MNRKKGKEDKKKVTFRKAMSNNMYLLKLAYQACPGRVVGEFVQRGVGYVCKMFTSIILMEFLLDSIEKKTDFKIVLMFLTGTVIGLSICNIFRQYYTRIIFAVGNQKLYERLHVKMFEKATDVELECFEDPDYYNKYTKAASQIKGKAFNVIDFMAELTTTILTMIFLCYKTVRIDPVAIVFSVLPVLANYLLGNKENRLRYELYHKTILCERKKDYVKRTLYLQNFAKEMRLSNIYRVLIKSFNDAINEIIARTNEYGIKLGWVTGFRESINQVVVVVGAIIYVTVRLVYYKNIKVSDYVVLVNSIHYLSWMFKDVARIFSKIQDNSLYIQNIKDFLEYKPKISESQDGILPEKNNATVSLENVSYTYLGQNKTVLNNINMEIKPKQKIALVGHNGAGKTTLVKLIMRLYDATEGKITLNGIDVKAYNVKAYRDLYATVFQDYKVLSMSVAENVIMNRVKEEDKKNVEAALKGSGVYDKVITLKNGMDTTLTREFDDEGAVLSGGEYQKIAIARVFAKECDIAILDEPSSALDPIAEYQMYESMLKACKDKAVIFISHRLSSAILADKIYMLEEGRIIEEGTHKELMELSGKYAKMFAMQAKSYK